MTTTLQFRRYTTAELSSITGAQGEILVDTTKKTLTVQDGSTAGGTPLATETFVTSAITGYGATVSSLLLGYASNANLTSTLTNYPTNANLTSTVNTAITNLIGGAPAVLDTLGEIATALNNNSSLAVTLTSSIALKANSSELSMLAWTSMVSKLQSSGYTVLLSSNGALVPSTSDMDLGTSGAPFRSLYITNNTFYFGGSAVSIDSSNTFTIATGSSTSTLVNTVALNTATSAVQSNITVLLYNQVSSITSSVSYQINDVSSNLTNYVNQVSSDLTVYVDSSLSSALTSLGTVSDLNLGSDALFFTGEATTSLSLGYLYSSASIGAGASSILIRNPSYDMGSSVLNLTTGSTIFADVSSSGTTVQLPFDLTAQATWVSSWGEIIYAEYQFYGSFGGGSSYLIQGYTSGTVNTSATHTIRIQMNNVPQQATLYEGTDFTISGSSITIIPTYSYVYQLQLFETTGTTTSVLLIPVAPNANTQNTWSGDPVYFDNLDVGYTTSSSQYNGGSAGKLVNTNPNGLQYYEDGTIIFPNGDVQSPDNFNIYTSSGSTNFEFTTSGIIVLPPGGDIVDSSGISVLGGGSLNTSVLSSYTTNANLSSTSTSYVTNANLTSTLTSYTTNANLTSTLTSYVTNANLTSTLGSYATSSNLSSLSSNVWRAATTSTLGLVKVDGTSITISNGIIRSACCDELSSVLTSYATIANLNSSISSLSSTLATSLGSFIDITSTVVSYVTNMTDTYTSVTATSGILTLNFNYDYHKVILNQNVVNINFVNLPTTGVAATMIVEVEQNATGGYSISGSSFLTAGGVGLIVSTAASAISVVTFTSRNGGSRVFGTSAGRDWI